MLDEKTNEGRQDEQPASVPVKTRREKIGRQALHCARQTFWLPESRTAADGVEITMPMQLKAVTVESPLPEDMAGLFSAER